MHPCQAFLEESNKGGARLEDMEAVFQIREERLTALQKILSPKFYHSLETRIQEEKKTFRELLHGVKEKEEELSHYSFVLHPYYFEQQFLDETT
jgi:transcription termination factor NusB